MIEEIARVLVYISIYIGLFTLALYLLTFVDRRKIEHKLKELPKVSIIIPAYNEEKNLEKTVDSAENLDYPKDKVEILIIDDGSKDKTFEVAKKMEKKYSRVRAFTKKNGGKATAMNLGIKKAKGEIIVSFDADSVVVPQALIKMMPYFADPQVMGVTPALKVYKPKGILQRIQALEYDLGVYLRKVFANINAIHVTPGPFSAYRKSFFEKYGGYEVDNITEDMEVALRIQSLNYRIENCLDAVVYSRAPRKFFSLTKQRRRWYFGMIYNLKKYKKIISKEHGELGLLILPLAIFSIFMTLTVTTVLIIKKILDHIKQIHLYSNIGFDFLNNFEFKTYMIMLDIYKFFSDSIILFFILFFVVGIVMLLVINRRIKSIDKPISIFLNYIFFIYLYNILFSIWWVISIIYSMTKKHIDW